MTRWRPPRRWSHTRNSLYATLYLRSVRRCDVRSDERRRIAKRRCQAPRSVQVISDGVIIPPSHCLPVHCHRLPVHTPSLFKHRIFSACGSEPTQFCEDHHGLPGNVDRGAFARCGGADGYRLHLWPPQERGAVASRGQSACMDGPWGRPAVLVGSRRAVWRTGPVGRGRAAVLGRGRPVAWRVARWRRRSGPAPGLAR